MKNLLAPYEQRPWAQTNWILVRLWRVSTHKVFHFLFCFCVVGTIAHAPRSDVGMMSHHWNTFKTIQPLYERVTVIRGTVRTHVWLYLELLA